MKHYSGLAKHYFLELEGLHLYPRNFWRCVGAGATLLWLIAIGIFIFTQHTAPMIWYKLLFLLSTQILWMGVIEKIKEWKKHQFIDKTNSMYNKQIEDVSECRLIHLEVISQAQPSEFLRIANEIENLLILRKKFQGRTQLVISEFWQSIYHPDSKARLITLSLAIVSMLVALSLHSSANLDNLFEALSNKAYWALIFILLVLSAELFFLIFGLRILLSFTMDMYASWYLRFSTDGFEEWLLSYYARDLVSFYKKPIKPESFWSISVQ